MIFRPTPLEGLVVVELEEFRDERGSFARSYCQEEFEAAGLGPCERQCNVSTNRSAGTLRGLHMQTSPHLEAKLVRCTRGAIYDVAVDARPDSPTLGQWHAVELRSGQPRQLYIAGGFLHGFLTLEDDTEVAYQMSTDYAPDYQVGCRYNDQELAIDWPANIEVISQRDLDLPSFASVADQLGSGTG